MRFPLFRKIHLWYIFSWIISLFFIFWVYHSITVSGSTIWNFWPSTWSIINYSYTFLEGFLITGLVASIVSFSLSEIKHSFAVDHIIFRKFLPTIRFLLLLIVWICGSLIILESMHIDTAKFLTWAGIGWAIFAFASKDIIANILWSLSIILSKMFEIGDTIRIRWVEWVVEEISLNTTKIMSTEGKLVYMPNRTLNTEQLENLTRRRFFIYAYRVPLKKALWDPKEVQNIIRIIEGKLSEYRPIEIKITTEVPNANDFVYIFTVKVPEEDDEYDRQIREFLIPYIFPEKEA